MEGSGSMSVNVINNRSKGTVYIISDGTGETASTMTKAALVQFEQMDITILRFKNIRNEAQVDSVVDEAHQKNALLVHTFVSQTLRTRLQTEAARHGLIAVDLLGSLLTALEVYFGVSSEKLEAGRLRAVDERYFRRIEAIEYTVKHDDGKTMADLAQADVVLVGISRTSKTPLSIFLSHKGWKVANVPLVVDTPLPEELFQIDQRRVVGLIIDVESLQRIRRNRLEKFGTDSRGDYADSKYILREIEYANEIFRRNKRWPVFNVTDRALEETASEITRVVGARLGLPDRYGL